MATADSVTVELVARTDKYISDVRKAESAFSSAVSGIQADATKAGAAMNSVNSAGGKAFAAVTSQAPQASQAIRGTAVQTGNLAAQFNDIAVQLAGGQSPFLIALQQGSQINQALGPGAGLRGTVSALGGAFASLVNPVGLATIAVISLGGAAVQYFTESLSKGEMSEKQLKAQAAAIQAVADKYGDAIPSVKALADEIKRAADNQDLLTAKAAVTAKNFQDIRAQVPDLTASYATVISDLSAAGLDTAQIAEIQRAFSDLQQKIADGKATTADLTDVQKLLNAAYEELPVQSVADLNAELTRIAPILGEAATAQKATNEQFNIMTLKAQDAKDIAAQLVAQLVGLGPAGSNSIKQIVNDITSSLLPNLGKAGDYISTLLKNFGSLESQVAQTPLGTLSPLVSGGGQFLNPDEFQTFKADQANIEKVVGGAAFAAIKKYEGFRQNAYFDVNRYRAGFGSDTVTRENGNVEKVTKDTTVSLREATLDLARRIGEFQDGIRNSIGADRFASFTEEQQAALTSVAYNYGSLPDRIVAAIKGGGDVGAAIRNLGSDNGGINAGRRNSEASAFGGSSASSRSGSSGIKIDPLAAYRPDAWEGLRERTSEQMMLNKQLEQSYNQLGQVGVTALDGLASALADGKLEGKEVLGIVIDIVKQLLSNSSLLGGAGGLGGGAGGGLLNGILGIFGGFRANGGPVNNRSAYVVGEHGPELFAPNQAGSIIPKTPTAAMMGGRGSGPSGIADVRVFMDDNGNWQAEVARISDSRVRNATPRILGASQQQTRKNFGSYAADFDARGA